MRSVIIVILAFTPHLCSVHLLYVEEVKPNLPCHLECRAQYIFFHLECCAKNLFNRLPFLCANVMDGQLEKALLQLVAPIPLQLGR